MNIHDNSLHLGNKLFFCPITQELFKNPVVTSDGFTFEKLAIERLSKHGINFNSILIRNRMLIDVIECLANDNDLDENIFYCPISQEIVINPVISDDGYTYEKNALEEYLKYNAKSPMNPSIELKYVFPNKIIKKVIQETKFVRDSLPHSFNHISNLNGLVRLNVNNSEFDISQAVMKGNDIVLVVDTSYSTSDPLTLQLKNGNKEDYGYSILDFIKFAIIVILKSYSTILNNSRISIIIFNSVVDELFPLIEINSSNFDSISKIIENLESTGATNIYDAVSTSINTLNNRDDKSRNASIILITDGRSNSCHTKGIINALEEKIKESNLQYPIHTIGIGYLLDKGLLPTVARVTGGIQTSIFGAASLPTSMFNTLSTIFTTYKNNLELHFPIEFKDYLKIFGNYQQYITEDELIIKLGILNLGQDRHFIFEIKPEYCDHELKYYFSFEKNGFNFRTDYYVLNKSNQLKLEGEEFKKFNYDFIRYRTVETISYAIKQKYTSINGITKDIFWSKIMELPISLVIPVLEDNEIMNNLRETIIEQIIQGLEQFWDTWGKHYLESISISLNSEVKNNILDKALSHFGGKLFEYYMERMDSLCRTLDPIKPSYSQGGQQVVSMSKFNISKYDTPQEVAEKINYGCFAGDAVIELSNKFILVSQLKKGDTVVTPFGNTKVKCIIKIKCDRPKVVKLSNNLIITPWHPVKMGVRWNFPCQILKELFRSNIEYLYDLVLEDHHIVKLNGCNVICWGHNYSNGILKHDYFGSEKVIKDLEKMPGWKDGLINLDKGCFIKKETICGITYN